MFAKMLFAVEMSHPHPRGASLNKVGEPLDCAGLAFIFIVCNYGAFCIIYTIVNIVQVWGASPFCSRTYDLKFSCFWSVLCEL
jgi:hypothetical protein